MIEYERGEDMSVRKSKTRTNLTIQIKLKEQLQQIAKEEDRSFNSLVIQALEDFLKRKETKE